MALTIDSKVRISLGNRTRVIANVDFDSSYPTGGESFSLSDFGLKRRVDIGLGFGSGYFVEVDRTNNKILVYYANNDSGSDGPLIEVANGTNLSSLTNVRIDVTGV